MAKRIAVVLFNLGGPDSPEAVQPFLFNLFNDPAIIGLPNPFRWFLARFISSRRAPVAREIYGHLGGKSPLLGLTGEQADALEARLSDLGEVKCFIAMRYWHPMTLEAAERVRDFKPDEIVLLPLYPQFSNSTTGSSLKEWKRAAGVVGLSAPTRALCCYPENPGWIDAQVDLINQTLSGMNGHENVRLLFSAHGLPKRNVERGDPYQSQIEMTVEGVVKKLDAGTDWVVCYQSRVGRLEWIGPSTDDELKRAAQDGKQVVVVPIAFVSEHSETLVELDIEYRELADELGIKGYHRVPAAGVHEKYIGGLNSLTRTVLERRVGLCSGSSTGGRICEGRFGGCPMAAGQ